MVASDEDSGDERTALSPGKTSKLTDVEKADGSKNSKDVFRSEYMAKRNQNVDEFDAVSL